MGDFPSYEISSAMLSTFNVNAQKTHQLAKKVKSLESDRDLRLLNVKVERDELNSESPSMRRKFVKTPTFQNGMRAGTSVPQLENFDLNGLHRDEETSRLKKPQSLPTLHLNQAYFIATPPRSRKIAKGILRLPINSTPSQAKLQSPLASPLPSHKVLTRFSSSPPMSLRANSSASKAKTLRKDNSEECTQPDSPWLRGSSTESFVSLNSPVDSKLDQRNKQLTQRPVTASVSGRDLSRPEPVHRGLLLMPVSSSKPQKPKEKRENVFDRLYPSGKKREMKICNRDRETPFRFGDTTLKATRRWSLSLSDLSASLEEVKACRYLRDKNGTET